MQKEFIGIAAHELRNPIQPILGLAEIVKSKIKDAKQYESLDIIIRNAKRLKRLTEDILDVTRIESQSLDLKKIFRRYWIRVVYLQKYCRGSWRQDRR